MSNEFNISTGMPSDEMSEYVQMFVDETSEQLDQLVEVLLYLEKTPHSPEQLNESFRLIHSIKGAAAMMGLDSITLLTHHLENYFDRLRSGVDTLNKSMMNLILKCIDYLRDAIELLRHGMPLTSAPELIDALSQSVAEIYVSEEKSLDTVETEKPECDQSPPATELTRSMTSGEPCRKRIVVYLDQNIELPELKAELILSRLSDLAVITKTSPDIDQLASLAELRTLQIWLNTATDDMRLRAAAEVVGVDLVEIDDVATTDDASNESVVSTVEEVVANEEEVTIDNDSALDSNVLSVETEEISADRNEPNQRSSTAEHSTKVIETLRVDIQRLDRLMNLAGELVVNRARFVQISSEMSDTFKKSGLISLLRDVCELLREPDNIASDTNKQNLSQPPSSNQWYQNVDDRITQLRSTALALEEHLQILERGRRSFIQFNEAIDQFSRVAQGLQRGVLDTRMVPVGPLFNRFKRTVRDISIEMGKSVNLIIRGENTELDKRMIDELGDPLVHLVRNAIDHGIESESVRRSRGKSEAGTLTMEASHTGNNVLITITDDGEGINFEKIKRRAVERGLVSATEVDKMPENEISQFIWTPGFSTADVVSDISGRGVGMDIVKTRIGELNGTVEVESAPGKGTRFIIRLPLTLAIIRSLLFQLRQGTFAAPIEHVREIVSISKKEIISVHGRDSIEVRGEFIPLIRIEDVFDWHDTNYSHITSEQFEVPVEEKNEDLISVLILSSATSSMGLVVCELQGCQDVVVKPLDENFTYIRGLAGASILGDGSVCLLLDVASCLEIARQRMRLRNFSRANSIP
jgi:two-component system chemotaxis sensor kinase CheA